MSATEYACDVRPVRHTPRACTPPRGRVYTPAGERTRPVRYVQRRRPESTWRWAAVILALLLVACGGGAGSDDPDPSMNDHDNGGDTGMVLPPFDATKLSGGVLATFAVGQEKFRAWFTRAENTQRLVDAFANRAAPVASICMRLRQGSGEQQHNAPWTWSVDTLLPADLDGLCLPCVSAWPTPSAAEAGINGPSRFNCTIRSGNAVGVESRAFMPVTLLDVVDRR